MRTIISNVAVILALIATARAYSGGAPEGVCEDMTPKHPAPPQTSRFPYTVSANKKEVKTGEELEITISGGKPFKGFLVQVRDGDNKPVGNFKIADTDKFAKTINCLGGKAVSTFFCFCFVRWQQLSETFFGLECSNSQEFS